MNDPRNLLQDSLATIRRLQARLAASEARSREPIAIIGAGCRYPGEVENVDDLWRVVRDGVDAVSEVPADRWDVDAYYDPDPAAPNKIVTRRGGFVGQVDRFDPQFFGISPREAQTMDPQQRLLLETAYEALENAGLAVDQLVGSATGVFVGITTRDYARMMQASGLDLSDVHSATGGAMNAAAGRISFTFGFQGPSMALDTACSSALVATHLACQSLRTGESDLALAGGVNLILSPDAMVLYSRWGILAPDGACKTFDADADGFGRAEGCAVIALKRLSDALEAGDPILAVIRGSAVNSDGRSSGLTVPNGPAQEAVLRKALANAGLKAADIDYVEAMGTGTPLGDLIEVEALGAVLGAGRPAGPPLRIGSVKTNLGHAEAASGLAGLLKTVMALRHETLPPNLHFSTPNPRIDWERLPIEVQTTSTAWPRGDRARRAGVSSFGFSGTNAHLILEEAPVRGQAPETRPGAVLLPLSARNDQALRDLAGRYARTVQTPGVDVHALAAAAGTGRSHMACRAAVSGGAVGDLAATLRALAAGDAPPDAALGAIRGGERPKVAFLFTGQGAQYAGMGRTLYEREPVFRAVIDRAQAVAANSLGRPLTEAMFGDDDGTINQTAYTQPALFALEYALAEQWRAWGVVPAMVLGHGLGEYVAACVAGVFDFESGFNLIVARGRAMQDLPEGGAMAVVLSTADRVAAEVALYADGLSVAALNGPEETVIAGTVEAVDGVLAALAAQGVEGRRLEVSHAFHSPLLEPMLAAFEARAAGLTYALPKIPLVSSLTGRVFAPGEGPDAAYWRRHAREPVHFVQGLDILRQAGVTALVEIGPHPTLIALAGHTAPDAAWAALPSLRRDCDDRGQMLQTLAALYVRGQTVRWDAFAEAEPRRRAPLPTYPFQRERVWLDDTPTLPTAQAVGAGCSLLGASQIAEPPGTLEASCQKTQTYRRGWKEIKPTNGEALGYCLVVGPAAGVGPAFADALTALGVGADFASVEDASRFEAVLAEARTPPAWVIECGLVDVKGNLDAPSRAATAYRRALNFAQAMAKSPPSVGLGLLSMGAQVVEPGDSCDPAQTAVLGLARSVEAERPQTPILRLDLDPWSPAAITQAAEAFLALAGKESEAAIRHGAIFAPRLEMPETPHKPDPAQRQALRIGHGDDRDNPRLVSEPRRAPRHGEVEIEVRAAGLNCRDDLNRYPGEAGSLVAGVVAAVGDGVESIAVGDSVLVFARDSVATHAVAPANFTVKIPPGVDFADAATAPSAYLVNLGEDISRNAEDVGRMLTRTLEDFASGRTAPLPVQAFDLKDGNAALRFMANTRHAGRIVLMPTRNPAVSADGAYLVTGGLGGLGLATARWLADHGAGEIWLTARSEPSAEQNAAVAALPSGSRVRIARCDVSNVAALEAVIGELLARKLPLRGVFHAAGVLDDATLDGQDEARYAKVAAAKSDAAWRLSELTSGARLDFFVLFSSCSSAFGSPGQANYCASNAFLDGLAAWRRAHGKVATSVAWGAWDVGMVAKADDRTRARWLHAGLGLMSQRQALTAMETVLAADFDQAAILALDPDRFLKGANRYVVKLFEDVVHVRGGAISDRTEQEAMFTSDDPARRQEAVAAFVREEIARVLGFSAASLDENAPLLELGLDSLMAVQIRNAVGVRLRLDVPLKRLLEGVTAAQLTAELSQAVAAPASAEAEVEWEEGVLNRCETVVSCPGRPLAIVEKCVA